MQEFARRAGSGNGSTHAKEHSAIQTCGVRLCTQHNLLWNRWIIVHSLRRIPTQMAGVAGGRLFDDRAGTTLGSDCELFGEQEVQIGYVIARADGRVALSACCEGRIETQPKAISPSQLGIASPSGSQ